MAIERRASRSSIFFAMIISAAAASCCRLYFGTASLRRAATSLGDTFEVGVVVVDREIIGDVIYRRV